MGVVVWGGGGSRPEETATRANDVVYTKLQGKCWEEKYTEV